MKNRDDGRAPGSDRSEGSAGKITGDAKENAGSIVGGEKMKRQRQADRPDGKFQDVWGSVETRRAKSPGGSS